MRDVLSSICHDKHRLPLGVTTLPHHGRKVYDTQRCTVIDPKAKRRHLPKLGRSPSKYQDGFIHIAANGWISVNTEEKKNKHYIQKVKNQ